MSFGHNSGQAFQLRWYQEEAVEALFQFFADHGGTDMDGFPVKANPVLALPTGTGKSAIIAEFLRRSFLYYPQTRAMMLTHVKELISQNAKALQRSWPVAPLGIYSAGLKSAQSVQPIIFGGIRSTVKKYPIFGYRDFLIIDEAHLVSPNAETSYATQINELMYGPDYNPEKPLTREILSRAIASPNCNPFLKVILLTATPYRMGLGHLTNGGIATKVAYDLTNIDGFSRLIAEGFLAPLIPKKTQSVIDVSAVKIGQDGDFQEGALQVEADKITLSAVREILEFGWNRHSWLVFASGIEHAEHVAEALNYYGVPTAAVHSKLAPGERDKRVEAFKRGELRCIVNQNILTTGFDHPPVDLIAMLRPTMSTGLWVQMLGRGTRPYDYRNPGEVDPAAFPFVKENCLVLDFAGNTRRLGPINDPVIPKPKGNGPPGEAPVRICEECGVYNHARATFCINCGAEFTFAPNINRTAGTDELLRSDLPQVEYFNVSKVVCVPHTAKATGRSMIKVAYYCEGLRTFFEHVTVEGKPGADKLDYAAKKGRDWFRQRYPGEPPETNAQLLQIAERFVQPRQIRVWINRKYPEILSYEF